MPPLPIFLMNAMGCALLVIGTCTLVVQWWPEAWLVRALGATGRLAFSWYMAHIIMDLGGVIVLGWLRTSHFQAFITATAFSAGIVVISVWWRGRFQNGPLEYILRHAG